MRIGILTLPLHTNYGGILQAYALQTVLERMGHEVEVFSNNAPIPITNNFRHRYLHPLKMIILAILCKKQKTVDIEINTRKFINTHIHERGLVSFSDINKDDYDAIIVGSDQIWRYLYFHLSWGWETPMENAFLSFTKDWDIRRIAYAASFGMENVSEYPKDVIAKCANLLSKFNGVSVREKSGVDICAKDFGVDAKCLVDPTMLLTSCAYLKLLSEKYDVKPRNELMSYILDETPAKDRLRQYLARKNNWSINIANGKVEDDSFPVDERIQPPVENWLSSFARASFVFTDSFHACVFSILFHRQFVVIGNKERGLARFRSLLRVFGLENRMILNPDDYHTIPDIDYSNVDLILNRKREEAISFLSCYLK